MNTLEITVGDRAYQDLLQSQFATQPALRDVLAQLETVSLSMGVGLQRRATTDPATARLLAELLEQIGGETSDTHQRARCFKAASQIRKRLP